MEYFISAAGIPVHINESKKDGIAILLLHGYLETLYVWNEFIDLLPSDYRIISIDLPGHGLSGIPEDGFTPEFFNIFTSSLLDKLSVSKCHFITHTCGFRLAYHFSTVNPDRVLSIFNISSSFCISIEEDYFINRLYKSISEGTFSKFVSLFIPKMYFSSNLKLFDDKIEETIEICETHDPESLSLFLRGISSFNSDIQSKFNSIVPLYCIAGQYDLFLSGYSEGFDIISECGTNSFIEKSQHIVNQLLIPFLSANSTKESC